MGYIRKCVTITPEQDVWCKKHSVSLSQALQSTLGSAMAWSKSWLVVKVKDLTAKGLSPTEIVKVFREEDYVIDEEIVKIALEA